MCLLWEEFCSQYLIRKYVQGLILITIIRFSCQVYQIRQKVSHNQTILSSSGNEKKTSEDHHTLTVKVVKHFTFQSRLEYNHGGYGVNIQKTIMITSVFVANPAIIPGLATLHVKPLFAAISKITSSWS